MLICRICEKLVDMADWDQHVSRCQQNMVSLVGSRRSLEYCAARGTHCASASLPDRRGGGVLATVSGVD